MKRVLLIATLIFASCAAAPARGSGEGVSAAPVAPARSHMRDNLRLEKNTTLRLVVRESAGVNDDRR